MKLPPVLLLQVYRPGTNYLYNHTCICMDYICSSRYRSGVVSVVRFRWEHMAGKIEQRRHLKKTMIHKREQEDEDDEKKVAVPPGKQSSKPDSPIRPHALQHAHVPSTPPQASSSSSSDKPNWTEIASK